MSQATPTALPCAACKQPVIEKRTLDGALVVLDAATKRVHLCVKRKEVEAAKAKQISANKAKPSVRPAPRPPVKRPPFVATAESPRPAHPPRQGRQDGQGRQDRQGRQDGQSRHGGDRPRPPARAAASQPPRKVAKKQRPRKTTLRSPEQVTEILKGGITRWRTGDGPTSFCENCGAPVLVGFSHVRWDVIMVDAAGHRTHDCETSRQAAAALRAQPAARPVDVPELPAVETRRPLRTLAPVAPAAPVATAEAKPRRRPAERTVVASANSCEACGNLKASVNGEWVCLHCA
jgi:hypothetical protein